MNIWILVLGEPIYSDAKNIRLHRAGNLSKYLINAGHNVTFWTSNVDHVKKSLRCKKTTIKKINKNLSIILLAGGLYKKNVSFARIFHNVKVAKEFKKLAKKIEKPDIVITNYPIIELSNAAVVYSKENNIPSIVDIRDFWPDIFYETLPNALRFLGDLIFWSWKRKAKNIIKNATAVTGITDEYIKWARKKNNQSMQEIDKSFPLAYEKVTLFQYKDIFLKENNIDPKKDSIYCFFGNLSKRIELETIVLAAKILNNNKNNQIKFVICGVGEQLKYLQEQSKKCPSIILPGWINNDEINTLMEISKAGILPYPSTLDFMKSFPNKVGEYLSKDLPIISSVQGEMKSLLENWNCGITYENNNPNSLINAINFIEGNESERKIMTNNAKECFKKKFDSKTVYGNYVSFIESFKKNE